MDDIVEAVPTYLSQNVPPRRHGLAVGRFGICALAGSGWRHARCYLHRPQRRLPASEPHVIGTRGDRVGWPWRSIGPFCGGFSLVR
jgi:hypothetical protein